MELLSVCVGQPRAVRSKSGWSGIHKQSVSGPVQVGHLGLSGDHILDTAHHGGTEQAVYLYTAPDYAAWTGVLGRTLEPGTFGENLIVSELESAAVRLGQRLRIGDVVLEVASARVPCVTLAERMGDPDFVKKFREMRRPGMYARVVHKGHVQAGDSVELLDVAPGESGTILDNFEAWFGGSTAAAPVTLD